MDADALQAFLAQPHEVIIATNRAGKGSQLSPVWVLWDGESFLFNTQKTSLKYANIVRDPNISIIINDPVTHTYVTAYGRAEILEAGCYPSLGDEIVAKYIPAEQRGQFSASNQDIEQATAARAVIVLRPEKVIGHSWAAL